MNEGAFRGILLVGVATLIGIVLLASGFDDTSVSRAGGGDDGGDSTTTTVADGQTITPSGDIDPQSVPVVVANGAGVEGVAGAVTDELFGLGYNPGEPVDATSTDPTGLDTVYFLTTTRSYEPEAQQVAADLGLTPDSVLPWPVDNPPASQGFATVVVVLGPNGTLAESAVANQSGTTQTTVAG